MGGVEDPCELVGGLLVDIAQEAGTASQDGHLGAERSEDMGEFHSHDPGADDDQASRLFGTAHHSVGSEHGVFVGVDAGGVEPCDIGDERVGPGGDDDAIGGDLLTGGCAHGLLSGEVNVFGNNCHVGLSIAAAVLASSGLDRVDAGEDAFLESGPIHLGAGRGQVVAFGLGGLLGQGSGVDEHLRRNAPDVEAGSAEVPFLGDGGLQTRESLVEEHISRTGADEQQVIVRQSPSLRWCVIRPAVSAAAEPKGRHGDNP